MPWPLRDGLVLSSHPSYDECAKRWWTDSGVAMITLSKKPVDARIPPTLQYYRYHPIPDGIVTPDRERLIYQARDWVWAAMHGPDVRLTVVHCLAGRSRSGLIGALVMQLYENWTGAEALDWVRRCRPKAVNNPNFERFLLGLGRPHP